MKRVLYITKRLLLIGLLVISFGVAAGEAQAQTVTVDCNNLTGLSAQEKSYCTNKCGTAAISASVEATCKQLAKDITTARRLAPTNCSQVKSLSSEQIQYCQGKCSNSTLAECQTFNKEIKAILEDLKKASTRQTNLGGKDSSTGGQSNGTAVKPGPTSAGKVLPNGGMLFSNFQCSSGIIVFECTVGGVFDATNKYDQLCACCGECQLSSFLRLANQIMRLILGIAGSLALMMFVFGGAMIVGSGGNASRVQKGKSILTNAVLGVIIVLFAYSAVSIFLSFFKLNIDGLIQKSGIDQVDPKAFRQASFLTPDNPNTKTDSKKATQTKSTSTSTKPKK